MTSELIEQIVGQGGIAAVLIVGLVMMYKYFATEQRQLKDVIREKDAELKNNFNLLMQLQEKQIETSSKLSTAIELLTERISHNGGK